jgi:glutamine amidotransferase
MEVRKYSNLKESFNRMITIIDYGMGNLRSVEKAFKFLGAETVVTSCHKDIEDASKIVLPGVGHFKKGMENLKKLSLVEVLTRKVKEDKVPVLGICLGMQLMTRHSEEGEVYGLGWVNAKTKLFKTKDKKLKVPHMGWNNTSVKKESNLINIDIDNQFYFVHSFFIEADSDELVLTTTDYIMPFTSAFEHENIIGVQFHPEKSHSAGLKLLNNFITKY